MGLRFRRRGLLGQFLAVRRCLGNFRLQWSMSLRWFRLNRRRLLPTEFRSVGADVEFDADGGVVSRSVVILLQPSAQFAGLHPYHGNCLQRLLGWKVGLLRMASSS